MSDNFRTLFAYGLGLTLATIAALLSGKGQGAIAFGTFAIVGTLIGFGLTHDTTTRRKTIWIIIVWIAAFILMFAFAFSLVWVLRETGIAD